MARPDYALKVTAATPQLWGAVYMMLVFTAAERAFHAWQRLHGVPTNWRDAVVVAVDLLVCPLPVIVGIAFQRLLKREANRTALSPRTYKICSSWIPQMLILAYVTMVL
jgi:hypothetical protein